MFYVVLSETCKFCDLLLDLFDGEELNYEPLFIEDYPYLRSIFKEQGYTTVPMVWHNEQYIGGFEDTEKYIQETRQNKGFMASHLHDA
jgi:glutaredoxin